MNRIVRFAGLLAFAAACLLSRPAAAEGVGFDTLLKESRLRISVPEDFREIPPPQTPLFSFERAWVKKDGSMEIRLALRPIARMIIEYDDPHNSAPDPNDIYQMMFTAMVGQFARQGDMPVRDLPFEMARRTFNADWASIAMFGADPELNTRHREAMLLGIHKNKTADAYLLFLYDDPKKTKPLLDRLLRIMKFDAPTPLEVLRAQEEAQRKARDEYLRAGGDEPQCVPPEGAREIRKGEKELDQSPEK